MPAGGACPLLTLLSSPLRIPRCHPGRRSTRARSVSVRASAAREERFQSPFPVAPGPLAPTEAASASADGASSSGRPAMPSPAPAMADPGGRPPFERAKRAGLWRPPPATPVETAPSGATQAGSGAPRAALASHSRARPTSRFWPTSMRAIKRQTRARGSVRQMRLQGPRVRRPIPWPLWPPPQWRYRPQGSPASDSRAFHPRKPVARRIARPGVRVNQRDFGMRRGAPHLRQQLGGARRVALRSENAPRNRGHRHERGEKPKRFLA